MKTLLALFLFAPLALAQLTTIQGTDAVSSSRSVINTNFTYLDEKQLKGTGAPSTTCSATVNLGWIYVRTDAGAASSSFYSCGETGPGTYSWELLGTSVSAIQGAASLVTPGCILMQTSTNGQATCSPLNYSGGMLSNPGSGDTSITGNLTVGGAACPGGAPAGSVCGNGVYDNGGPLRQKSCLIIVGDPGAASPALANDNSSPAACTNDTGFDWTIKSVACYADAGSPTVDPIVHGGSATSVLTANLTCGTAAYAAGTVKSIGGAPVVHSFSADGATCSTAPCTIDANMVTAGGTAKYMVIKIVGYF